MASLGNFKREIIKTGKARGHHRSNPALHLHFLTQKIPPFLPTRGLYRFFQDSTSPLKDQNSPCEFQIFLIHLLLSRLASARPTSQDYALLFKRSSSLALLGLYKIGKKQDTLTYFTSAVRPGESAQSLFARRRVECAVCPAAYLIFSNQTQNEVAGRAELNKTQVHLLFRKKSDKGRFHFIFQRVIAAEKKTSAELSS